MHSHHSHSRASELAECLAVYSAKNFHDHTLVHISLVPLDQACDILQKYKNLCVLREALPTSTWPVQISTFRKVASIASLVPPQIYRHKTIQRVSDHVTLPPISQLVDRQLLTCSNPRQCSRATNVSPLKSVAPLFRRRGLRCFFIYTIADTQQACRLITKAEPGKVCNGRSNIFRSARVRAFCCDAHASIGPSRIHGVRLVLLSIPSVSQSIGTSDELRCSGFGAQL